MEAETRSPRRTLLESGPDSDLQRWGLERQALVAKALEWSNETKGSREETAQNLCVALIEALRDHVAQEAVRWWKPWKTRCRRLPLPITRGARQAVRALSRLPLTEACFCISTTYTALLPTQVRAARGAFYTPPALADRLLDLIEAQGVRLAELRILDPACGGGAFLLPVADRILNEPEIRILDPNHQLARLEDHLVGIEIDSFAAWLTQSSLQILACSLSEKVGRGLAVPIRREDALEVTNEGERPFDLVIGNPPYGRVRLDPHQRETFRRSLFGHANSYGLFLDAALRWRTKNGLIAFVTPTSFLGGRYFCRLRNLLLDEAPPRAIEVVEHRTGVFDQVQQETCLAVFGPKSDRPTEVQLLHLEERSLQVIPAGVCKIPERPDAPWLLPRTPRQAALVRRTSTMHTRLHHLGYKASTGPLVWNRHKDSLRARPASSAYPLVWAEAVRPNRFCFEYRSRAHAPFVQVEAGQEHLLDSGACVLVQRTTAKEQRRRLVACSVPRDLVEEWDHFVVENHVNVLRASGRGSVSPSALAAVLNTETVDQVFRCLSGSVAVSATELHALPLPPEETFRQVETLLAQASSNSDGLTHQNEAAIENLVAHAYGAGAC